MLSSTDPTVSGDRDRPDDVHAEADTEVRITRLAARVAGSDLDPESLELILAALTADVCDELDDPGEA